MTDFLQKDSHYHKCTTEKNIHRLFITSGGFHLINSLAIIEQLKVEDDASVINYVLVWSSVTNDDFERLNKRIAQECGITHYYSCCGPDWFAPKVAQYIIERNLTKIDEVYSLQLSDHMALYGLLYRGVKHIITDEGVNSIIPLPGMLASHCEKLITTCYLDKIDYVSFPARHWQVEHIDIDCFRKIADKCVRICPWECSISSEKKAVVFCASYFASWRPFSAEYLAERQRSLIRSLVKCGFHILYKPHPRDPELPEETEHLTLLHTRLPMECYRLSGIMAVVSLHSSASTQSYHYNGVPGFIDTQFCRDTLPEYLSVLTEEYTPSVQMLLELQAYHLSPVELQQQIERIYLSHIKQKPLLSANLRFSTAFLPLLNHN